MSESIDTLKAARIRAGEQYRETLQRLFEDLINLAGLDRALAHLTGQPVATFSNVALLRSHLRHPDYATAFGFSLAMPVVYDWEEKVETVAKAYIGSLREAAP